MNRKSFYYHFRDKYDLVNSISKLSSLRRCSAAPMRAPWALIGDLCEYFYENRAFYHNALSVEGRDCLPGLLPGDSGRARSSGPMMKIFEGEGEDRSFFQLLGDTPSLRPCSAGFPTGIVCPLTALPGFCAAVCWVGRRSCLTAQLESRAESALWLFFPANCNGYRIKMGRAGKYAVKFFQLLCTSHLPPLFGRRYIILLL